MIERDENGGKEEAYELLEKTFRSVFVFIPEKRNEDDRER